MLLAGKSRHNIIKTRCVYYIRVILTMNIMAGGVLSRRNIVYIYFSTIKI